MTTKSLAAFILAAMAALLLCFGRVHATEGTAPIRVLILSGRNNHDWRQTTPALEKMYRGSDRFVVDVTEDPNKCAADMLAGYDVLVSNWCAWPDVTGRQWGPEVEKAFVDFVGGGKGFVLFHAASATFHDWPEYQQIVGATWKLGTTGHGAIHSFKVTVVDANHPVTAGVPDFWIHDELWHRMGAQPKINVLCRAFSSKENGGSGLSEPVVIWTQFGKGRCFYNILGHDARTMQNTAWRTLMLRGTEWAATGKVMVPIADNWPSTSDEASRQYAEPPDNAGQSSSAQQAPPIRTSSTAPGLDTARGILNEFKARRMPDKGGEPDFCGLDLSSAAKTGDRAELPDLFARDPNDPNSYRLRSDIILARHPEHWCSGVVYYVPAKNRHYVSPEPGHPGGNPFYGPFDGKPWEKLGIAEPKPAKDKYRFAIYLVADPVDAGRPNDITLEELRLAPEPIITEKDLLGYDWDRHTLKLTPGVRDHIPPPGVWGVPFVVVADGKRCYLGAFWTHLSSYMPNLPVAYVDSISARLDSKDSIRIEPPPVAEANDPRGDPRIRRVLEALNFVSPKKAVAQPKRTIMSLAEQLEVRVDVSGWTLDTTFGQAIDDLKNSVDPPLRLIVLWRDLYDNAGIDRQTPIMMDGMSEVPLRAALSSLLMAVAGNPGQLGYVVEGGVITVGTKDSLKEKWQTRVYDISDLL